MSHVPLLIFHLLQVLDPHVRDVHTQAIVKPHTSLLYFTAQCWHAANIFSNGNGIRMYRVNESVGEHQVNNAVNVHMHAKVLTIVTREAYTYSVVMIKDRSDCIEAEAVKLELVQEVRKI